VRTIVANRLATRTNGKPLAQQWIEINQRHQSGTGNQQWIALDWELVEVGKPLKKNTVWLGETMPGVARTMDISLLINTQGYFGSYNIPFLKEIREAAGYDYLIAHKARACSPQTNENPEGLCGYHSCPRAKVFARDHEKVTDLRSMQAMMRFNHWQTDPLALGNAANQIASRGDFANGLNGDTFGCAGATDAKIVSLAIRDHAGPLGFVNIASPTYDSQPAFVWSEMKGQCGMEHLGQPDKWEFPWFTFT